jgi:hypothetical protein
MSVMRAPFGEEPSNPDMARPAAEAARPLDGTPQRPVVLCFTSSITSGGVP